MERSGTQHGKLGSASLHPTYKKMATNRRGGIKKKTVNYSDNIVVSALSSIFSEKKSGYNAKENSALSHIQEPIVTAPPEVKQIIQEVLEIEKDRLYKRAPKINDDILKIIKEVIQ